MSAIVVYTEKAAGLKVGTLKERDMHTPQDTQQLKKRLCRGRRRDSDH